MRFIIVLQHKVAVVYRKITVHYYENVCNLVSKHILVYLDDVVLYLELPLEVRLSSDFVLADSDGCWIICFWQVRKIIPAQNATLTHSAERRRQ